MSELNLNDLAIIVNKRVVRNLALSVDHKFEPTINLEVLKLQLAAAASPAVKALLDRGVEHPIEIIANLAMPVPRVLYATSNPAFAPVPAGLTDQQTLLNRLARYDAVATGSTVQTIPAEDPLINNPCPIVFKEDPNKRFTFFRTDFFQDDAAEFVEVVANGLQMTIKGKCYRGDLFSRHLAFNAPTHDFELKLQYTVTFINDSDVNLGAVPFKMVAAPPAGSRPLPAIGRFVYARRFEDGKYVIPPADATAGQLTGGLFQGQLDDLIYETETGQPVYQVEPRSPEEPQRFVIRKLGSPTILAEAQAGRLALRFDKLASLSMSPDNISPAEKTAIGNSLIRIQPTLAQTFTCAAGLEAAPVNLNLLDVIGPTSLDIPIMPRSLVLSSEPSIVTAADVMAGDPGPVGSVKSVQQECDLTTAVFYPASQSFGVCGRIGGAGDPTLIDFSAGADFSAGLSQTFVQPILNKMAEDVKAQITASPPEGLDTTTLAVSGQIVDGAFRVHAQGEGEIETPFFMPNIDYDFDAKIGLRFRAQRAVVVDAAGLPEDRFSCPIPVEALDGLGINARENQFLLPAAAAASNPLSFLAYFDPAGGAACFDCALPLRIPPPILDAMGSQITIDDAANPPAICDPKIQQPDDPQRFGQASFVDPNLKPQWEIAAIPPTDDDVEVDVDVSFLALFFTALLGALLAFAVPVVGGFLGPSILITGVSLAAFSDVIVSAIASGLVQEKIAKQNLQSINPDLNLTSFLGIYLDDPAVRTPFALQGATMTSPTGALITRFHVVVQAAGVNETFGEG